MRAVHQPPLSPPSKSSTTLQNCATNTVRTVVQTNKPVGNISRSMHNKWNSLFVNVLNPPAWISLLRRQALNISCMNMGWCHSPSTVQAWDSNLQEQSPSRSAEQDTLGSLFHTPILLNRLSTRRPSSSVCQALTDDPR